MASMQRLSLTSIKSERFEASARTARALKEVWLRERQHQLARQLTINADVRKRWVGADLIRASISGVVPS